VAKKKSGGGVRALAGELEAALIPVNRAAGRRALARMAREARRIALGLGRAGAIPPQEPKKRESQPEREEAKAGPFEAPTAQRPRAAFSADEAATVKRRTPGEAAKPEAPKTEAKKLPPLPPPKPGAPQIGRVQLKKAVAPLAAAPPPAGPVAIGPAEKLFGGDEVDDLLSSFGVSGDTSDKGMSHELKALVGLDPTPPPPGTEGAPPLPPVPVKAEAKDDIDELLEKSDEVRTNKLDVSAKKSEPPKSNTVPAPSADLGKSESDGVEDLLALADSSMPLSGRESLASAPPAPPLNSEPPQPIAIAAVTADRGAPKQPPSAEAAEKETVRPMSPSFPELPEEKHAPKPVVAPPPPPKKEVVAPPKPAAVAKVEGKAAKAPPPSKEVPSGRQPRAPKTGMIFLVILLVVLAGGAVGIWKLAPGFFTGRTPENIRKEKEDFEAQKAAQEKLAQEQRCKASLVISDAPAAAEILLRVGQAPTDVERMPMRTRLEFVATAEGFQPRRAVVLPTAKWEAKTPPRFDLAIQLDPSKAKPPALDPWPAGEPGADVGGAGEPGTIHVVSTPPGAEIWLLAGLGPDARIDQLKCDAGAEVLVAGSQVRKRLRINPGDANKAPADATGAHVVKLSAKAD
jgi:hypothetical protein